MEHPFSAPKQKTEAEAEIQRHRDTETQGYGDTETPRDRCRETETDLPTATSCVLFNGFLYTEMPGSIGVEVHLPQSCCHT